MDHAALVGRIDRLPNASWNGHAWRHVAIGRPALSGEGARIIGGRWNPPRSFAVLYLGSTIPTVIAEFHRMASKQRLAPEQFLPRTLHRYAADLHQVLDLRSDEALEELGVDPGLLRGDDHRTCQSIGEAAFACGREAILAPSVTGRGDVLAIYLERIAPGSFVRDDRAETWEQVPALDSV